MTFLMQFGMLGYIRYVNIPLRGDFSVSDHEGADNFGICMLICSAIHLENCATSCREETKGPFPRFAKAVVIVDDFHDESFGGIADADTETSSDQLRRGRKFSVLKDHLLKACQIQESQIDEIKQNRTRANESPFKSKEHKERCKELRKQLHRGYLNNLDRFDNVLQF